ncbi:hypothetical protein ACV3MX_07495 [Clostridium perfringens]|nr:hypothetical protein [Clostridium perfringens]
MSEKLNDDYKAIKAFFDATELLKERGIIKSNRYLGDIGEYISSNLDLLKLCDSLRNKGFDGLDCDGRKVEVKSHNAKKGTNIQMDKYYKNGNIPEFDVLLVVIGPESNIRPDKYIGQNNFLIYKIERYESGNIAKKTLSGLEPYEIISFDD